MFVEEIFSIPAIDSIVPVAVEGNMIEIPWELLLLFNGSDSDMIRTVSFIYSNVNHLFPGGLPGQDVK